MAANCEGYGETWSMSKIASKLRIALVGSALLGVAACSSEPVASLMPPTQKPASSLGPEIPGLEIDFPLEQFGLQENRDGTKFVSATGSVKNVSGSTQMVPSLTFVFRSKSEKIVAVHNVKPLSDALPAGGVMQVNASIVGIPKNAKYVDIGWEPD